MRRVTQRTVAIETADGTCPAVLCVPDGDGPWPAVIVVFDIGGMRDTMRVMAEHLSALGYIVLLPDIYFRSGTYEPVDMRVAFGDSDVREKLMSRMNAYTPQMLTSGREDLCRFLGVTPGEEARRHWDDGILHGSATISNGGRRSRRRDRSDCFFPWRSHRKGE